MSYASEHKPFRCNFVLRRRERLCSEAPGGALPALMLKRRERLCFEAQAQLRREFFCREQIC